MELRALGSSAGVERRVRSTVTIPEAPAQQTAVVVALRDEWNPVTHPDLSDVLARVITAGAGDVVIDLAEVDFIDTATFFTLASAARLLDHKGRQMTFRSPSTVATRVLNLFGLSDLIDDRDHREDEPAHGEGVARLTLANQ